ncbi:MAG TPA: hypothetical protein VFS88_03620 [Micavibrio sp.]|nr:hypothetical protein [Micavibrio sp.]
MSDTSGDKILGIVPKEKYVHFTYMFLLVSAAGGVFFSLLGIVGIEPVSATYGLIALGLLSLGLAVVGLTKHKADFSVTDHAHFKYIALLFIVFFVINIVGGAFYAIAYALGYLVTAIIGAAQAVLVWTGYNSWQGGRVVTKGNIRDEVKAALAKR